MAHRPMIFLDFMSWKMRNIQSDPSSPLIDTQSHPFSRAPGGLGQEPAGTSPLVVEPCCYRKLPRPRTSLRVRDAGWWHMPSAGRGKPRSRASRAAGRAARREILHRVVVPGISKASLNRPSTWENEKSFQTTENGSSVTSACSFSRVMGGSRAVVRSSSI